VASALRAPARELSGAGAGAKARAQSSPAVAAPGSRGRPNGAKAPVARLPGGAGVFPPASVLVRGGAGGLCGWRRGRWEHWRAADPRAVARLRGISLTELPSTGSLRVDARPGVDAELSKIGSVSSVAVRDARGFGSCRAL